MARSRFSTGCSNSPGRSEWAFVVTVAVSWKDIFHGSDLGFVCLTQATARGRLLLS